MNHLHYEYVVSHEKVNVLQKHNYEVYYIQWSSKFWTRIFLHNSMRVEVRTFIRMSKEHLEPFIVAYYYENTPIEFEQWFEEILNVISDSVTRLTGT